MASASPLSGRDRECKALVRALAQGRSVVVCGPPGIGKTALAEAVATTWPSAVVRARGSAGGATAPLTAFSTLLRTVTVDAELSDRAALIAVVTGAVAAAAGPGGLVLVDDVHLLDQASARIVADLSELPDLSVIATARSSEGLPDEIAGRWEAGLIERLDLGPLDDADALALITHLLGGPIEPASGRTLLELAAGSPMTARELTLAAHADGSFEHRRDVWVLARRPAPGERLIEIVARRVADLGAKERLVLDLLSVAGTIGLGALESLASPAAVEVVDRLGFLAVAIDGRRSSCRLAHPVHEEALREGLAPSRRRRLATDLADHVLAHGARRSDDLDRLARWMLLGGRGLEPHQLLEAAQRARFVHDYPQAEALARAAVQAGAGAAATSVLGEVLYLDHRPEEADQALAACAADTDELRTVIAVQRATVRFWALDDADGATDLLQAAAQTVPAPHAAELHAAAAQYDHLAGRPGDALVHLQPYLDEQVPRAFIQAVTAAVPALALAGRVGDADVLLARASAVWQEVGDQLALFDAGILLVCAALAAMEAGRIEEAAAHAELGHQLAIDHRTSVGQAWMALGMGRARLLQGRLDEAEQCFNEAAAVAGDGFPGLRRWALTSLLQVAGLRGDRAATRSLRSELQSSRGTALRLLEPEVEVSLAWAHMVEGRPLDAAQTLVRGFELAMEMAAPVLAAEVLHEAGRISQHRAVACQERVDAVRAALRDADASLAIVRLDHVTARTRGDATAIEGAAQRFAGFSMALHAAEAWTEAAALHDANGDRAAGSRCARAAADERARTTGGAATRQVAATSTTVGSLTPREQEVVALASQRLATKEIAALLGLRPRTVDNHLHRAYAKLGVGGKADLLS